MADYIALRNFQSFDDLGAEIWSPARVNFFVGPNNVGKSKLLQACQRVYSSARPFLIDRTGSYHEVLVGKKINEGLAKSMFPETSLGRFGNGSDYEMVGKHIVDEVACFSFRKGQTGAGTLDCLKSRDEPRDGSLDETVIGKLKSVNGLQAQIPISSDVRTFFMSAERDIGPEKASSADIEPNGKGVTNAIRRYLHVSGLETELVTVSMLRDLNEIMHPDYSFTDIRCLVEEESENWEVYLTSENAGEVMLSESGSGLKTIIHLLAYIYLSNVRSEEEITGGSYFFEELENSLHPRMQRNLYNYIENKFGESSFLFFSTHSPVAIDFFQSNESVKFYEVFQKDSSTKCREISAFSDQDGLLDELGVRASQALQSNFVIWVEGPTDRLYLKQWISLFSEKRLVEGRHYSIMFYGGALAAHVTLEAGFNDGDLVKLLKINRKCAVMIDSDRTAKGKHVRGAAVRLKREAENNAKLIWVTTERSVENCMHPEFWCRHFSVSEEEVGPYVNLFNALKGKRPRQTTRAVQTKVELAHAVVDQISVADVTNSTSSKTKELIKNIEDANS